MRGRKGYEPPGETFTNISTGNLIPVAVKGAPTLSLNFSTVRWQNFSKIPQITDILVRLGPRNFSM